jgi:hypothetical protein
LCVGAQFFLTDWRRERQKTKQWQIWIILHTENPSPSNFLSNSISLSMNKYLIHYFIQLWTKPNEMKKALHVKKNKWPLTKFNGCTHITYLPEWVDSQLKLIDWSE